MEESKIKSIVGELFKNKTIEQIQDIKPSYWIIDEWEEDGEAFESYTFYVDGKLKLTTGRKGFEDIYKTNIKK